MECRQIAYGRVSTKEQNLDRQIIAFQKPGIPQENIFMEKQSGKIFDRAVYQKMITELKEGDTLHIKSVDRLGRNYEEIIEQWRYLTREKHIFINVIDMPILNTTVERDLMGNVIVNIILELQSAFAQAERDNIRQRQAEGIAAAKKRGVKFGTKPKKSPKNFLDVKKMWESGEISAREAARRLGVCHKTFLKWARV